MRKTLFIAVIIYLSLYFNIFWYVITFLILWLIISGLYIYRIFKAFENPNFSFDDTKVFWFKKEKQFWEDASKRADLRYRADTDQYNQYLDLLNIEIDNLNELTKTLINTHWKKEVKKVHPDYGTTQEDIKERTQKTALLNVARDTLMELVG